MAWAQTLRCSASSADASLVGGPSGPSSSSAATRVAPSNPASVAGVRRRRLAVGLAFGSPPPPRSPRRDVSVLPPLLHHDRLVPDPLPSRPGVRHSVLQVGEHCGRCLLIVAHETTRVARGGEGTLGRRRACAGRERAPSATTTHFWLLPPARVRVEEEGVALLCHRVQLSDLEVEHPAPGGGVDGEQADAGEDNDDGGV
eukprot:CAMPEP_0181185596 /NCGR_PEP_ID=MMETSP1096-20121128/9590_1 /TAXON_ID=156174 ORGANISM="Chrysochromulina ericina, Strain CCMP281" /NCGR_SAMPLE_ID=MMETSP1096 /ASSEMBLY_ACC=CAM_ASM_000453 /LENGTH=199 /DNA_ID=CAMNT_0023274447 /DNA_START=708 /DNA_END=1307 /DNA_ORIENTATION=+